MSFLVLVLTFHSQLSQVDLVAPSQVQEVMLHQVVVARTNYHCLDSFVSWVPTSDFFFLGIVRSICLCREIRKRAVWQTSEKVLETCAFCVCDSAPSFLGLGNGRQVLYSASNKRSAFCDSNDTFSYERLQRSFLVLEVIHGPKEHTTLHSRTLVFARTPVPAPFTCTPMPSRSGLTNFFAVFSK